MTPLAFRATPLGLGYGRTRFASPADLFKVLYISPALVTGVAETIVRDRFVGRARRRITTGEVELWGAAVVTAIADLNLLDIRSTGLIQLGARTDVVGAKSHRAGRRFSADIHEQAPRVDGLLYESRLTKGDCIAVYERAVPKLTVTPVVDLIRASGLKPALTDLNVELI